jgi:hypothetical protein
MEVPIKLFFASIRRRMLTQKTYTSPDHGKPFRLQCNLVYIVTHRMFGGIARGALKGRDDGSNQIKAGYDQRRLCGHSS